MKKETRNQPSQLDMLHEAVTKPGVLATCYRLFHRYSLFNQFDAMCQCNARKIEVGPINTFKGWEALGRRVKKGEKALWMTLPVTVKDKKAEPKADGTQPTSTFFAYKPRWFVLSQTEGDDYTPPSLPDWSLDRALAALDIEQVPFEMTDGNCQGYATRRTMAVNPVASHPRRALFHDLAPVALGHTAEVTMHDTPTLSRDIRELEAECVSLLVASALEGDDDNGTGAAESRGYIQHWFKESQVPKDSATKILKVANQILAAGRPAKAVQS